MKNQRTLYLSLVLALLLGALTVLLLQGSSPVSAEQANIPADAAPPVASFTHSAPDEWGTSTVFTNTTTVSGTVSYFWEFGDGGTSAETHPTHVYPATGIYTVTLTATNAGGSSVAAEMVIVYGYAFFTSQTGDSGKVGPVNLAIFGSKQTPSYGDAYSCPKAHVSGQPPSYDPTSDPSAPDNPNRADFQDWRGYPFRIHIPADVTGTVRVEILDPDTYNRPNAAVFITDTLPITATTGFWHTPTGSQTNPYVYDWFDSVLGEDRYWFVRMDENRLYNSTPASYSDAYNTTTEYRLYYIARQPDGSLERVYIATYTGQPDNSHNTDLKWVCPGGSASQDPQVGTIGYNGFPASFEVDVATLGGIAAHDDGSHSLYLEVEGVDGWSENGFDLWAGPATPENLAVPADVNARNLWIDRQHALGVISPHDTNGVVTYGDGVLPLNVNTNVTYEFALAYIPEQVHGADLQAYHWDNDVSTLSICYWFTGYPIPGEAGATCNEGEVEGALSGGNSWTPPPEGYDLVPVPEAFAGDYLQARYRVGAYDTSTWRLTLDLDTTPPTGSILIEGGTEVVSITQVTLALSATDAYTVTEMRLRNDAEAWGSWEPYTTTKAWTLPNQKGEHTVWVQFQDQAGNVSLAYSDSIVYQPHITYLPLVMRED